LHDRPGRAAERPGPPYGHFGSMLLCRSRSDGLEAPTRLARGSPAYQGPGSPERGDSLSPWRSL